MQFVSIVFDKAVMEPNFANLYADLCIKMKDNAARWPFVHVLFDQDSNQYRWIRELGYDLQVAGPYPTVRDCEDAASGDAPLPVKAFQEKIVVEKLVIILGRFIKVFKAAEHADHFYVCTQQFQDVPAEWYSDNAFPSEEEAWNSALKKNSFHYRLFDRCQNEFMKTNPYEEADVAQAELDARTDLSTAERSLEQAKVEELRGLLKFKMLGNIRFIGELYKVGLLKMNIMETCLERLLGWDEVKHEWSDEVDEHFLESLCKLYATVGAKFENEAVKKNKNYVSQDWFKQRLQDLAQDKRLNARLRFAIQVRASWGVSVSKIY
jgi:translation initiation factor 4G